MLVRFRKSHPEAVTPLQATSGAAGLDLVAVSRNVPNPTFGAYVEYDTGICVEIPPGYVGLVFPRSSISDQDLSLANAVGVIDSDYRGSIKFRFRSTGGMRQYKPGDRIGQLVITPTPVVTLHEVGVLGPTERGDGAHGSTGR